MADNAPLLENEQPPATDLRSSRVASLDVFRGLCVFLMMVVDYGGTIFPIIAHSPWNGLHLADFVMPFFLFIAGVSLALVYKKVTDKGEATWKALLRAIKLFFLGVLLQGGYLHGVSSLTYGVDIERIRWLGILQRISIGYIVAALCEIWLSRRIWREMGFVKSYYGHWSLAIFLCLIYMGLSYGLYVPDWQFEVPESQAPVANGSHIYMCVWQSPRWKDVKKLYSIIPPKAVFFAAVKCSTRGDHGPACNAAGMIDRYVIGINHLYMKPVFRNLRECNISRGQVPENSPSWCHAPFDPEGILGSLTAGVTCIIGLQYGHVLTNSQHPGRRLRSWSTLSVSLLLTGTFLVFLGIPVNKSLYTVSYTLITSSAAGVTFSAVYLMVDVYGYRHLTSFLEWIGKHSLVIFVLVTSNVAVILIQGFYWRNPTNNIVHWIVTRIVLS